MQTKYMCILISIWFKTLGWGWRREIGLISSKIFYWPFQGGTSFVDLLRFFFLSCVCYAFVRVCLYVPCGHLLGKGWPLVCGVYLLVCHFPIGILGQLWNLIVSIPDRCTLTYVIVTAFIMQVSIEIWLIRLIDRPYFFFCSYISILFLDPYSFIPKCHLRDKNTDFFPLSLHLLQY